MSVPPPPNPYGSPPPSDGRSWGGQPPGFGGPPQNYGGPPQGPPPWGGQPQWSEPAGPPPGRGGRGKWILGGLAVVLAIALAVVITVLVVRPDSGGGGSTTPTNGAPEFASANDVGPVNIITEDPTCEAWGKVSREYAAAEQSMNWASRDFSVPASSWTPQLRATYEGVAKAMTRAADQTANLTTLTPHRVMRELYEQFIAYAKAFVERLPSYAAVDDNVAVEVDTVGNALANICGAIDYKSAPAIAPLVAAPAPPSQVSIPESVVPVIFLKTTNPICSEWAAAVSDFATSTEAWRLIDPQIAAAGWTPEQKSTIDSVAAVMLTNADELERLGRQSANPSLEDFAVLAAQYRRAYVAAIPTYSSADSYLAEAATQLVRTVQWACKASA